jgi:DNA-binding transcriptional regulator YiaG
MLGTLPTNTVMVLDRSQALPICASGAVSFNIIGTKSKQSETSLWECLSAWTNAGFNTTDNYYQSSSSAIMELRRISGFTWEQLARLFGVSRRSLHFWASGEPINAPNEEHLRRLLATVKTIDRGNASENRSILLSALPNGGTPFDLLTAKEYEDAIRILGGGIIRKNPRKQALYNHARKYHTPRPQNELVGARQDSIHIQKGHLISSTPIQTHGRK